MGGRELMNYLSSALTQFTGWHTRPMSTGSLLYIVPQQAKIVNSMKSSASTLRE